MWSYVGNDTIIGRRFDGKVTNQFYNQLFPCSVQVEGKVKQAELNSEDWKLVGNGNLPLALLKDPTDTLPPTSANPWGNLSDTEQEEEASGDYEAKETDEVEEKKNPQQE